MDTVSAVGSTVYGERLNLCIWNKSNAGMGSLYRSKHELVFVYRVGTVPHLNMVELGKHGRNRTNVWDYASMNSIRGGRRQDLALHPTVKPTGLVADAIQDVTRRGDIVLDLFLGSGTTLLAAERTGRRFSSARDEQRSLLVNDTAYPNPLWSHSHLAQPFPLTRKITGTVKLRVSSAMAGGGGGTGSERRTMASAASSKT